MAREAAARMRDSSDRVERDRIVAATVIQWLGSNVGFGFLEEALRKCGYRIERSSR